MASLVSEQERAVYSVIRNEDPYVNPAKDIFGQIPLAGESNKVAAQNLIQLIVDSVPEPPVTSSSSSDESSEPSEKVIPPLEQGWIDTLNLVFPHTEMISTAAQTLNAYTSSAVNNYVETVPINSTGAFVLDSFEGNQKGSVKFARSYQLLMTESVLLVDQMLAETKEVLPLIPKALNIKTISSDLGKLNNCLETRSQFLPMVNTEIAIEKAAQSELVKAAKDYVLMSLSMSWGANENTKALIKSTGSDALKEALKG